MAESGVWTTLGGVGGLVRWEGSVAESGGLSPLDGVRWVGLVD